MKFFFFLVLLVGTTLAIHSQNSIENTIDSRAYNVYTAEEIKEMPDSKIAQINFLIRNSFIVPSEMHGKIDSNDINGMDYTSFRKEDERVKIPVLINKETKSQEYIILLSFKELDQAYQKIQNKYK